MEKILTLIIPTYNMEKYLDTCLTSLIIEDKDLLHQVEVLVIIDGATDRSSEIAHTYQDKYPNTFVVIDKENGNYGSCINCGLKKATGKYIKVLDADDSFNTVNFEYYLKKLLELDVDLVLTDFVFKNEQNEDYELKTRGIPSNIVLEFSDVVEELSQKFLAMHAVTYKKSIFSEINYNQTEGISYTDIEWCFLPMTKVSTIYYSKHVVYRYLLGREGQTVSNEVAAKSISHKIIISKKLISIFMDLDDIGAEYRVYLQRRLNWGIRAIYQFYLLQHKGDCSPLINLDSYIKDNNTEVYNKLGEEKIHYRINFRYINNWRKSGYKKSLKLYCLLFFIRSYNKVKYGI